MVCEKECGFSDKELYEMVVKSAEGKKLSKVLIIPPDYTRMYSGAGKLAAMYYTYLCGKCQVDVMPALGTHLPMTEQECNVFFEGKIPYSKLIVHNWRKDIVKIGEVPAEFVTEVSEGICNCKIDVEVNRRIVSGEYDLIISLGQVVPHEVAGMANYSKNIFVGCGGSSMINSSHMLGAFYGMERIMGRDFSPVRRVFDYAQEKYLSELPILYVLTVTTNTGDDVHIHGIWFGGGRESFAQAVALSQKVNFTTVKKPLKKVIVLLDEREFRSTWLGNKAIYRTRMAIADGGELIVLAKGVCRFGEDEENDRLVRKYGYCGRENVLRLSKENPDLQQNMSVAAHLIHGSSDGRFKITYCTEKLTEEEVRSVCFDYLPYKSAVEKYNADKLVNGYNTVNGEEIYYIDNPALGLWRAEN